MDYSNPEHRVYIQVQDSVGTWRTYHTTINDSQRILSEMETQKRSFPDKRVRAVDGSNRLIDMLG